MLQLPLLPSRVNAKVYEALHDLLIAPSHGSLHYILPCPCSSSTPGTLRGAFALILST